MMLDIDLTSARHCIECGSRLLPAEVEGNQAVCGTCREVAYLEAVAEEIELDRLGAAVEALPPEDLDEYLAGEGIVIEGDGSEPD